jgi:hypothetical protein
VPAHSRAAGATGYRAHSSALYPGEPDERESRGTGVSGPSESDLKCRRQARPRRAVLFLGGRWALVGLGGPSVGSVGPRWVGSVGSVGPRWALSGPSVGPRWARWVFSGLQWALGGLHVVDSAHFGRWAWWYPAIFANLHVKHTTCRLEAGWWVFPSGQELRPQPVGHGFESRWQPFFVARWVSGSRWVLVGQWVAPSGSVGPGGSPTGPVGRWDPVGVPPAQWVSGTFGGVGGVGGVGGPRWGQWVPTESTYPTGQSH